jgi:hypothetical protein
MAPFEMEDDLWHNVMEGLVLSEYSLLLGAGASFGAVNSMGESLPGGRDLSRELALRYGIPLGSSTESLRTVYDLAQTISRRDGLESPELFLKRRFLNCSVPSWYEDLVRIPWHIIWNLNIDDVLERAYTQVFAGSVRQSLRLASWDAPQAFLREPSTEVYCVHLHGQASRGGLVFGSLEYLAAVAYGGAGHRLFWDSWLTNPVIVVGASLSDELDMAAPLSTPRANDDERPSIVVLPDFSEFDEFRLTAAGLLPIRATAADFFEAVRADWTATVASLEEGAIAAAEGISPSRVYFLQHFRPLRRSADRRHDFFAGQEPVYADILEDRDGRRRLHGMPREAGAAFPSAPVSVVVFHGVLSGTTTAELRFLYDCELAGLHCYEYDGEAAFDPAPLVWMAQRDPLLVLRIEELDDFPDALKKLVDGCSAAKVNVRIVASARPNRLRNIEEAALGAVKAVAVDDKLADGEIRSVVRALEKHHRLNILSGRSLPEQIKFFSETHHRSLVDALGVVSQGRGFMDRIRDEYQQAAAQFPDTVDLILLMAELGYPVPEGVVARTLRQPAASLRQRVLEDTLGYLVVLERGHLRVRQQSLAAKVSREQLSVSRRYRISRDLAIALSPYVSRSTIAARTRPSRIVGQLMDAERIYGWFGRNRADEWYQSLYDYYGWNSRYWEQRALAECADPNPRWEMAESWAREAVAKHSDPYSLNTLGVVLFRRAMASGSLDEDRFFAGLASVTEAKDSLNRSSEHPYVTALSYLRRGYELSYGDKRLQDRIRRVFNSWSNDSRESTAWQSPHGRRLLDEQIRLFLKAVARGGTKQSNYGHRRDRRSRQ